MARKQRMRGHHQGTIRKRGTTWSIRYQENGKRVYEGGFSSPDLADQALKERLRNIQGGHPARPEVTAPVAPSRVTFDQMVDDFQDDRDRDRAANGKPVVGDDRWRWDRHIRPVLGHMTPYSVTSEFLEAFVRDLRVPPHGTKVDGKPKAPIKAATATRVMHLLSAFYQWARGRGIKHNPIRGLVKENTKVRALLAGKHNPDDTLFLHSKEDIAKVYEALPYPVNVAYALCALAGLRPGEAIALRWVDVDFEHGEINVCRSARNSKLGTTKNSKARKVPMVASLVAVLQKYKTTDSDLVAPPMFTSKKGIVFTRTGRFLGDRAREVAITAALKRCKLPKMSFVSAGRHTFGSQWCMEGLPIRRLQKIMGHASIETTMKYVHLTSKMSASELQRADVKLVA